MAIHCREQRLVKAILIAFGLISLEPGGDRFSLHIAVITGVSPPLRLTDPRLAPLFSHQGGDFCKGFYGFANHSFSTHAFKDFQQAIHALERLFHFFKNLIGSSPIFGTQYPVAGRFLS